MPVAWIIFEILINIVIIIFYILVLGKKKNKLPRYRLSLIICFIVPIICIISVVVIYNYMVWIDDMNYIIPDLLTYIFAISYLLINVIVLFMYERINKEAEKNYILTSKNKQYEMTAQQNNEIMKIYSNISEWQHDYANHIQIITKLLEQSETKDFSFDEAINYIKALDKKITADASEIENYGGDI